MQSSLKNYLTWGLLSVAAVVTTPLLAKEKMNFAYGFPATSAASLAVEDHIAAAAERSNGEIEIKGFPMTLLSLSETNAGVRDNLADIGYVLTAYYPTEYSTNLFLHELNSLINLRDNPSGKEPLAYAGAMLEYTFNKCPECIKEFSAQNQVYTGGGVTPLYNMLCKDTSITSINDIKGKRLRAAGAGFVRFAEHFGAQGVRLPLNEVYEALDQGIVECAMLSAPELINYNLNEVVTDITLAVPGGAFAGVASANINADRWKAMGDAEREALLWAGAQLTASATWNFYVDDKKAIEDARARDIKIHEASPDLIAAVQKFSRQDLQTVADLFTKDYGVARAEGIIEEFRPLLEKWYGLVKNVETKEQLHQLYWDQVSSKVNPATYPN